MSTEIPKKTNKRILREPPRKKLSQGASDDIRLERFDNAITRQFNLYPIYGGERREKFGSERIKRISEIFSEMKVQPSVRSAVAIIKVAEAELDVLSKSHGDQNLGSGTGDLYNIRKSTIELQRSWNKVFNNATIRRALDWRFFNEECLPQFDGEVELSLLQMMREMKKYSNRLSKYEADLRYSADFDTKLSYVLDMIHRSVSSLSGYIGQGHAKNGAEYRFVTIVAHSWANFMGEIPTTTRGAEPENGTPFQRFIHELAPGIGSEVMRNVLLNFSWPKSRVMGIRKNKRAKNPKKNSG